MSARVQGLILGLGLAKQADIATASASFLRFKKIDTTLTSPHPVMENDAAEVGKGNEFISGVYPVSYDVATLVVAPAEADNSLEWFWTHRFVPMQSWEPGTAATLASVFKHHVFPALGRTSISKLDRDGIQMVIQKAARECSKSVVHKVRCYLKACLDEATDQDLLVKNPMRELRHPDVRPECRRFLSMAEIESLLASMDTRDRLICRILLVCGLRPGELFGAKWDDFDADTGRLRIDEAAVDGKLKATKTVGSRAFVWMPMDVVASLKAWHATQSGTFLFPSKTGGPMHSKNFLRRHIWPAAIVAGIMQPRPEKLPKGFRWVDRATSVNFQAFRRTCATWFQMHGTAKDIQAHLRHTSPATTMGVYVQSIPESVRVAVEALDKMLFEQKPAGEGRTN